MSADLVRELIARCRQRQARVLVVGDGMWDAWVRGHVERVSPEAPCPVLRAGASVRRPGGAANVAEQLRTGWRADVRLLTQPHVLWPSKVRFVAGDQTLLRVDDGEDGGRMSVRERRDLLEEALALLSAGGGGEMPEVVVLSDYDKGTLDASLIGGVVRRCRELRIRTVGDHKRRPVGQWRGVDVLKMNAREAAAAGCLATSGVRHAVVTHGSGDPDVTRFGPSTCVREGRGRLSVPVRSVSGAGDCFTAFLALALAHGFALRQAATLAHLAGGAYVQRRQNEPPLPHEVLAVADPVGAKVLDADALAVVLARRHADARVLVTNGCFDGLHPGHLHTLEFARARGDVLVVALNDDASVRRLKGDGRPLLPLAQRQRLVAALACVDYVLGFTGDTPAAVLAALAPRVAAVAKGPDWAGRVVCSAGLPVLVAPPGGCRLHTTDLLSGRRAAA